MKTPYPHPCQHRPNEWLTLLFAGSLLMLTGCMTEQQPAPVDTAVPHVQAVSDVDAGRYLVMIGGCNDCHTANFLETNGAVPESEWLVGVPVGFRGPWGTSYPQNLRMLVRSIDENSFVEMAHVRQSLPPMPWPSLNSMSDEDLRSIYRYIHSLGPKGEAMPAALGPDAEPTTPYFDFVPKNLDRLQTAALPPTPTPQS